MKQGASIARCDAHGATIARRCAISPPTPDAPGHGHGDGTAARMRLRTWMRSQARTRLQMRAQADSRRRGRERLFLGPRLPQHAERGGIASRTVRQAFRHTGDRRGGRARLALDGGVGLSLRQQARHGESLGGLLDLARRNKSSSKANMVSSSSRAAKTLSRLSTSAVLISAISAPSSACFPIRSASAATARGAQDRTRSNRRGRSTTPR